MEEDKLETTERKLEEETEEEGHSSEDSVNFSAEIINLVEEEKILLFHDQEKIGYVKIDKEEGYLIHKIRSEEFRRFLSALVWKKTERPVQKGIAETVIATLEGKAVYEGNECQLNLRTAWHDGSLWYDLGEGKAVKINEKGWKIIKKAPILFRPFPHQEKQIEPLKKGELGDILRFLNIKSNKDNGIGYQILIMVYLTTLLIPDIPRPVLVVHGQQGSAKSTLLRVIKKLLDPSILDLLTYPRNSQELIQVLSHHYLVYFDNVSEIPDWLSDDLCRACTGHAFSKRKLYTDDDDVYYKNKNAIGMNGINLVAQKADLLDRSLIFELEMIPEEKRNDEGSFWSEFEAAKPKILGGVFDVLSGAIKLKNSGKIHLEKKPRLADFAIWGCAAVEAMGYPKEEFLEAYNKNIETQNEEALTASPVAESLVMFIEDKPGWSGPAKLLLDELEPIAEDLGLKKDTTFPKSTRWLWRRIKEVLANLNRIGIDATYDRSKRPRWIVLVNKNIEK